MADDSISREKLYDPRIAQPASRYAVNVGGSAITVTPFRAVATTSSQITFTVNVPSQTVFLDRAVELSAQAAYRFDVRCYNAQTDVAEPIFVFGRDGALEALPIHSLISTLTVIINDSSVTVDLGSTMKELLRLTDYAANRRIRTAPTMLDRYVLNETAAKANNSPLAGYENAIADSEVPNGAWWDIVYADPASGAPLTTTTASYVNPGGVGAPGDASRTIAVVNAVPQRFRSSVVQEAGAGNFYASGGYYGMAIRFRTQEFLMVSPLIFADSHEESVGIFGVNNMQVTANLKADVSRTIRCVAYGTDFANGASTTAAASGNGRVIGLGSALTVPAAARFGVAPSLIAALPFPEAILNCTFISPSVNQKLPSVSMVPWAEYPRYITNVNFGTLAAGAEQSGIQTQSLTIPVVPDLMVFYCKPDTLVGGSPAIADYTADWYLPITQISLNFDNQAGLLSTAPASQLYRISHRNGLGLNYDEWSGRARSTNGAGGLTPAVGGFLVLKPGIDFGLSSGIASGVSGNFVVQATVTVRNPSTFAVATGQIYLMCINSGFFATLAGSSRIMRNLLTEQDVVESPDAPENNAAALRRYVGGSFLSSLGNILSKGVDIARKVAPVASAIKPLLPDTGMLGQVKSGMTAVGLGRAGGGVSGGGRAGGGASGGAGLSKRLM